MGAASSSSVRPPTSPESEDAAVEPPWSLPPPSQDDFWLKMDLSMLVGTGAGLAGNGREFPISSERRRDGIVGDQAPRPPQLGPSPGGNGDEEDDWLAASLCLSMSSFQREEMELLVDKVKDRMLRHLSCLCSQDDAFCAVVTQRVHTLQYVHAAMSRQRHAQLVRVGGNCTTETQHRVVARAKGGTGAGAAVDASSAASGDALLGLQLFFSLLEFVRDPGCGEEQLADFLQQISPILTSLPPLCLANSYSSPPNNLPHHSMQQPTRTLVPDVGVVSSLRGFLATLALCDKADDMFPRVERERDYCSGRERGTSDTEQKEVALTAMVGLVAARGRASDLLVLVKVLLSMSPRKVDMVDVSQDESNNTNGLAEGTGSREGQVEAECQAKRRPTSRVKARTSRQGLPVDDEDDADEEGHDLMLVAHPAVTVAVDPAEPTRSGIEANGPWKSKSVSRPHPSGEKDVDGNKTLESHLVKGRKRKGERERAKITPPLDREPWVIAEHTSNQDSNLETPSIVTGFVGSEVDSIKADCILPLLRQLQATTSNGDSCLTGCNPTHEREVWTCGQNSYGELGHSDTGTRKVHCLVKPFEGKDVVDIAAGNEHTVLLCRTGEVYSAGYNDNGQCGQGTMQRVGVLTRVPIAAGRKAVQVHAYNGCEHTLVVLDDGQTVSFGYNYRGQLGHGNTFSEPVPKPVRGLDGIRVTQVSCSYYHSVIACDNGEVYTFGRNDFGQLGSGDAIDRKLPCLVDSLRGQRVTSMACGQYHTVISTLQIGVLSCGKNDYGQLGLESTEPQKKFTKVKGALDGAQVRQLRCGYYHTIVLAAGKHVFGFGRNDYGQLGLGHITQRVCGPTIIGGAEGKSVCRVSAGCYHTVLIGSDGMLYVFGRNHHGQLGTGDTNERHSPFPVSAFLGKRVAKVAAGFYHTIVLTGAIEEELSGLDSGKPAVRFSPYNVLAHPALVLPRHSSTVEVPADAASANKAGEGRVREAVSPEIGSPVCTDREFMGAPEEPANIELGKARYSQAESDFDGGICHRNGNVSGRKAAVVILAHMDRLAEEFAFAKGHVPVVGHSESAEANDAASTPGSGNGGERTSDHDNYIVDVSPDTFELLNSILASASEEEQLHDLGEYGQFQTYTLLAALRVLKANLVRLLQNHISNHIVESMLATPPSFDPDDAHELQLDGSLRHNPALHTLLFDPPGLTKGQADSNSGDQVTAVTDGHASSENVRKLSPVRICGDGGGATLSAEVERYRVVLYALQRRLLLLVQTDSSFGEGIDGIEPVQKEAAAVLVLGLELFFPGQKEQFRLLSKLIDTANIGEEDHRDCLIGTGCENFGHLLCGPRAARYFILTPLLQRLCSDALASKLIPYGAEEGENKSVCTTVEVTEPNLKEYSVPAASARLLEMQITVLVDLIAQGHACSSFSGESPTYGASEGSPTSVLQLNGSATNHTESFDVGVNNAVRDSLDSQSLTQRLLVDFVLTLTKHVMHWAASERITVDPICLSRMVNDAGSDGYPTSPMSPGKGAPVVETAGWFAERVTGLCDWASSVVLDGVDRTPSSWQCLIKHAQSVFKYSTVVLETALEKENQDGDEGAGAEKTDTGMVDRLGETVVGLLLPAVTTGLVPFAHVPVFARRLLDAVNAVVCLLDEICFKCPVTRLADEHYLAARNGEGEAPKNKQKPQASFMRGENGKLGGGGTIGRNGNGHASAAVVDTGAGHKGTPGGNFDSQKLPWLLSLAKTTALLAGKMAATVVVGDSGVSPFLEDYFRSPVYSSWLESDLLKGGCDPYYEGLLLGPLDITSQGERPDLRVPVEANTPNRGVVVTASDEKRSRGKVNEFLEGVASGSGQGGLFMAWLAKGLTPTNTAYRIVKQQAMAGPDGKALARVERAMMAAMLRQGGLDGLAALFSACLGRRGGDGDRRTRQEPPERLAALWKTTAEMAGWLWHARSKLRSADAPQSKVDALFEEAANSCLVLMLFRPVGSVPPALIPNLPQGSPSGSLRVNAQLTARRRWRKAVAVVRVTIRWRAFISGRMGDCILAAIPRFVRAMLRRASDTEGPQELSTSGGEGCLSTLLVLVLDNHQRAVARAAGIKAFSASAGSLRTRSLLADVLLSLAPAMQTPHLVDRHILSHLAAVGGGVSLGVTTAFRALLNELLRLLWQICQLREGEAERASSCVAGRVTTWDKLAQTNECKSSMPRWFDARTVLVLLEVWGLTINPEDWQFMETAGVIGALSHVAAAPLSASGHITAGGERCDDLMKEDEIASRKGRASQRQDKAASTDQRHRPLATCRAAAWTLFRALIIQLHGIPLTTRFAAHDPPQLDSIVEVLRTELTQCVTKATVKSCVADGEPECGVRRGGGAGRQYRDRTPSQVILEFAPPLIGGFPDSPPHGRGTVTSKVYGAGASHKRRCQELVSGPRRLMNMEDGLTFPAEYVLSNPRGLDFSITFWLLLAQDRTGHHRTVLARGHGSERWPVVLLRSTDNRLEVCFGIPSMGNLCERLTSKEPIQINIWTHVGLISEHNKLRLYFNGALDCQRTSTGALRGNRYPLYVGKVPDGAMRLDGVRGGVEGSIANLRYFTRALSPIHVRIICDPGPPETAKVEDRHLYHLCACLVPMSRSPQCRRYFQHPDWLNLLLQAFTHGTIRVQQALCRLFREILPHVPPLIMANIVLGTTRPQTAGAPMSFAPGPTAGGDEAQNSAKMAFVNYLLRLVGACSWYIGATMPSAGGLAAAGDEEASEMTVAQVLRQEQLTRFLPLTIAKVLVQGCKKGGGSAGFGSGVGENDSHRQPVVAQVAAHFSAPPLSEETVHGINTLGAEMVALVQILAATELWAASVESTSRRSLDRLMNFVDAAGGIELQPRPDGRDIDLECVNAEERLTIAGGEAVLHVLGGTVDFLCAGACIRIRETNQQCVVLGVDQATSTASVLLPPKEGVTAVDNWVQRFGTHELEVQDSDSLARGAMLGLSGIVNRSFCGSGASPGHEYIIGVATSFLRSAPLPRPDTASGREHAHSSNMTYGEILVAQCRSRIARAILRASRDGDWASSAVQTSDILTELLRVAILPCSTTAASISEKSLADTETVAIQGRIHQMLGTPGGADIVAGKIAEMVLNPGESTSGIGGLDGGNREGNERRDGVANHHRSSTSSTDRSWMDRLGCPFCQEEKTTVSGIVEHVLTKHSADVQRVPCPVCVAEKGDHTAHDLPTHLELVHFDAVLRDRRSFLPASRERRRESGGAGRSETLPPSHLVEQLMVIGFPEDWCTMALRENDNDVVNASAWIVDNLDMLSSLNNLNVSSNDRTGEGEATTAPVGIRHENQRQSWQGSYRFARDGLVQREERQLGNNELAQEEEEGAEEEQEGEFGEDGEQGQEEKYREDEESKDDEAFDSEEEEEEDEEEDTAEANRENGVGSVEHHQQSAVLPPPRSVLDSDVDDDQHESAHNHPFADGLVVSDHRQSYFPLERVLDRTPDGSPRSTTGASSIRSQLAAVNSKITGMELCQLTEAWLYTEKQLTSLYCRAAVMNILLRWPRNIPLSAASFGSSASVVQLTQNVLFGDQDLPISFTDDEVCGSVIRPVPNGAGRPKVLGVFTPLLAHLLRSECDEKRSTHAPTASEVHKSQAEAETELAEKASGEEAALGERGDYWRDTLSARLVSTCLDGLDSTATPGAYAGVSWGATEASPASTHSVVGRKPNLELFQWLLDLLLSASCADVFTEHAFSRLSNCLNSPHAAAKEVAMYALTSIATKWCERLAVDREDVFGDTVEPAPTHVDLPSPLAMEDTFQRHMAISQVRSALVKRIAVERRPGGLFFTRYTQTLTALYVAMSKLQRLLLCRRRQSVCTALPEADFAADAKLGTVTILYCTDSSIALSWLPLREAGSTSNIMYEVQMAARQLGNKESQDAFRCVYTGKRLRYRVEGLMPGQLYRFRLRAVHPSTKTTAWSAVATAETEQGIAFRFDSVNSGPAICVSGNGMSASFRSNETWSTILGTTPFCTGINYWELHLDKSATSYLFIGVATRDADVTTFLGGDDNGWGFIGDRALYHKRTKVKSYGERFSQGDTIGVTLNMDRGSLCFSKNGQDLGVAFEGLVGSLYPAVAFYNQGQRLSLAQSAFRCPGAGVTVLASPLNTMPEDVLALHEVMEAMVSRKNLPFGWMEVVRAGHVAWVAGKTVRYVTTLGFELQFDVSDSSCRRFGLRARGRVRTPRGNATVIGVCEGVMWFHVDGERGAWFFTDGEVWEGRAAGYFAMSALDAPGADGGGVTKPWRVADGEKAERAKGTQERDRPHEPRIGSFDENFAAIGNCAKWTPAVDGCIVAALCDHADRHQVPVWNCTPTEVLKILAPGRRKLELLLASEAVSDEDLLRRVSVLKQLNHELVGVLPFADLAEGVQVSGQAESRTFCWGGFDKHRGLAVGTRNHQTRGLGPLLVCLRRSIFLATKQQALSQAVGITTTHAKKAEDEYDYPEDLPQVTVNRLKAAAGQESEDTGVRLRTSVFHQLFRELHAVDTSLLRMGYTHPMDDGQQRTFKVKFEGEGVDDYGGPYREIFTQVAAELTSTVSSSPPSESTERKGSDGEYVLPFLEPTPSSVSGGGDVGVEYMVKADVRQRRHLRIYRFLGKLMGVALRCRVAVPWRLSQVFWKGLVGEALQEADLTHIDSTAYVFVQSIRARIAELKRVNHGVDDDSSRPTGLGVLTWTATARGRMVELRPGGRRVPVEPSDLSPYVREVAQACLHQGDTALFAVRDGFASVVPAAVLPLFTWEEVELQVCGRPGVDIDLLQANTEYDDDISWSDAHIQSFWRVLRAFDDRDRSQFLRFVWARSRLPYRAVDFHQKFKIHSFTGEGARDDPDQYLPKAHTCFFSINLPRYSSDEIMAKKLSYTMYNCIEMDADFRLADNEMPGWENEATARSSRGGQSGSAGNPNFADQLS